MPKHCVKLVMLRILIDDTLYVKVSLIILYHHSSLSLTVKTTSEEKSNDIQS